MAKELSARNNLDIVRLAAAGMVLYSHSFTLLGLSEPLFLSLLPFGPLGVYIFFTISGYLVSESWERDPNILRFFQRRLLRIIPGLAACVVLTVMLLGPLLTTLSIKEYFANPYTFWYLQNIVLHIVYYLPGVFEHNPHANAVNGSLWSLPIEFLMYIVVAFFGVLHGKRWVTGVLAISSALICLIWAQVSQEMLVIYNFDLRQVFICGTYFWVGAFLYRFKLRRHLTQSIGLLAVFAMLFLESYPAALSVSFWLLLPIVVLAFGFSYSPQLSRITSGGDYSYGIYIYAFPIQQSVVYLFPDIGIGAYLFLCTIVTYFCAALSWHLIERPALVFKPNRQVIDPLKE